jgi:predicted PhzF superfamily epimerase YddE/YHI9
MKLTAEVVNVFACADGSGGNPLGFVRAARDFDQARRQEIAARLGYSETVFVLEGARIAIHTPTIELQFGGHPMVGAAWLLDLPLLEPPVGRIRARKEGERAFITAPADVPPEWDIRQLSSPEALDALEVPSEGHIQYWAWDEEWSGRIRARVFSADYGVPEDRATGSAALRLCALLGRPIMIEQGAGSEILARPASAGEIEIGGRVVRKPDRSLQ